MNRVWPPCLIVQEVEKEEEYALQNYNGPFLSHAQWAALRDAIDKTYQNRSDAELELIYRNWVERMKEER